MSWKPKPYGSSGELAAMKALQDAKIPFRWQFPIRTRFRPDTAFIMDFLIPSTNADKYLGLDLEIDGGLHRHTWKGKPALKRMAKDAGRDECLKAEKYRILRVTDTEMKKDAASVIRKIREELAK